LKASPNELQDWLHAYDFDLPPDLIAARPHPVRDESRLLVFDQRSSKISHHRFKDLPTLLPASSSLFCNNTRVISCRVMANKESGAKVEIFFLDDQLDQHGAVGCLLKSSGKKRLGEKLLLPHQGSAIICDRHADGTFSLKLELDGSLEEYLKLYGLMPIPPYIRQGQSDQQDQQDYQTLFAKEQGSVAAPTASLHFTPELMEQLKAHHINQHELTLHVGLGTFKPLDLEHLKNKKLHRERFKMSAPTAKALSEAAYRVAVGTTSLRALESYQRLGLTPGDWCETDLFLMPGDEIQAVDGLITNFHLPKSSLLMLVAAFIGIEATKEIYQIAIAEKYRFFSYGDAMLLLRERREH
jgi:S-adenosylmethionine:tRNA ribosyltransferase-isomerase